MFECQERKAKSKSHSFPVRRPTRRSRGRGVTLWPVSPSFVRPRPLARALGGVFDVVLMFGDLILGIIMNNKIVHVFLFLFITATTSTNASTIVDSFNVTANPARSFFTPLDWGWFYTPSMSYNLTRIETEFSAFGPLFFGPKPTPQTVTVEILTAPRSDGGTLLGSASFDWTTAIGTLNGPTLPDIYLTAGSTYFIGLRNINGIGVNIASNGTQTMPGFSRFDTNGSGSYSWSASNNNQYAIFQFNGIPAVPPASVTTPVPTAIWLVGPALAGLVGFVRHKLTV